MVYYIHRGGDHYPAIYAVNLKSKEKTKLLEGRFSGEQFSLSPDDKKLYFSQYAPYKTFYTYSDLFVHDLNEGKTQQLTHGLRAFDPEVSPNSRTVVFVSDELGTMKLMAMDIESSKITTLLDPLEKTQFSHPSFSPDGKMLAFSIWQRGQLDIAICDANGAKLRRLTCDHHVDMHPVWTPDEGQIFFYSDRTGIPNIFVYDMNQNRLYQVTNVATGVFNPALSPDGQHVVMTESSLIDSLCS